MLMEIDYTTVYNEVILGIITLVFILLLLTINKVTKLNKKYKIFIDALSGKDVEGLLLEHMENAKRVEDENKVLKEEIKDIREVLKSCFQKYGIERFTAFEDVGSDLSFAISLLDGKDDGIILNGIYSREGSAVYAKPVYNGESKHKLSQEEQKSLERAKRRGKDI